jgi:hypothetical protein
MGGNLMQCPGDVSTRSADFTTPKRMWNITISTVFTKYMCFDIRNFYVGAPMKSFDYLHISSKLTPQGIIAEHNLLSLVMDGYICIEVQKCMYGLSQAHNA